MSTPASSSGCGAAIIAGAEPVVCGVRGWRCHACRAPEPADLDALNPWALSGEELAALAPLENGGDAMPPAGESPANLPREAPTLPTLPTPPWKTERDHELDDVIALGDKLAREWAALDCHAAASAVRGYRNALALRDHRTRAKGPQS